MKILGAALVAVLLGSAAFSSEAEARCWWNGYSWHCNNWRPHHRYWHNGYGPGYGYRHGWHRNPYNWGSYSHGYGASYR
jgi:hypothetical protein